MKPLVPRIDVTPEPLSVVRGGSSRPSAAAVGIQLLILGIAAGGFLGNTLWLDGIEAAISVFGSVLAFGVARMLDDRRRTNPAYADWALVPARRLSAWIMIITWLIGLVHVYQGAIELTRELNL